MTSSSDPLLTDITRSMEDLMAAIWSIQDELAAFAHSKAERKALFAELDTLHREKCKRVGHSPSSDGEECIDCGEWLT